MNYTLAAQQMIQRAPRLTRPVEDPGGLTLNHAHWMLLQIQVNNSWSDSKKGRWLGWAQAVYCMTSIFELEEMKALNRACSCDDEGCPQFNTPHIHEEQ